MAHRGDEEAAGLAEERHTTAFVVGMVLGGLAGAAFVLWTAQRSGAQTRALIADKTDDVLFRLTGMDKAQSGDASTAVQPVRTEAAARPGSDGSAADAGITPMPVPAAETRDDETDEAKLPMTFRGEVLTEEPTDVVLDGPRPASSDR
jgi:hypothetical protein